MNRDFIKTHPIPPGWWDLPLWIRESVDKGHLTAAEALDMGRKLKVRGCSGFSGMSGWSGVSGYSGWDPFQCQSSGGYTSPLLKNRHYARRLEQSAEYHWPFILIMSFILCYFIGLSILHFKSWQDNHPDGTFIEYIITNGGTK